MTEKTSPECCTHIRQEDGNWCFQACLQSFLFDNEVRKWTQKDMVELGIKQKCCAEKPDEKRGVIPWDDGKIPNYRNLIDFCALFDVDVEKINIEDLPEKPARGEGALIGLWEYKGSQHCVRFCERVDANRVRVMNPAPDPDDYPVWSYEQVRGWSGEVFKIRLRKP